MTTLAGLLNGFADPAQPFLTYYDAATGERVELSAVTTANWVAKTSNFLVDSLDAEPGTRLRLDLPTHWESFVWILSAWSVGVTLTDRDAEIAVVGPDLKADESVRVALSLKPLGLPFAQPPGDFIDFNAEVLGHSDYFQAYDPPAFDTIATEFDGSPKSHQEVWETAGTNSERILIEPGPLPRDCETLIATCRGGGSLVIAAHASTVQRDRLAVDERAQL